MEKATLETAVQIGKELVRVQHVAVDGCGQVPIIVLPTGMEVRNLEGILPEAPDRIRVQVGLVDVRSFIAYVNERKSAATRVFADLSRAVLTAAIDYHEVPGPVQPDLGQAPPSLITHTCALTLTRTEAWKAWRDASGKSLGQAEMAEFIEEHREDVSAPNGATMLEIARSMEATSGRRFKSKLRLMNGDVQFLFERETTATAGSANDLQIPGEVTLHMPIFEGGDAVSIRALFRYRIGEDGLTLAFHIPGIAAIERKQIDHAADLITHETEVKVFRGTYARL